MKTTAARNDDQHREGVGSGARAIVTHAATVPRAHPLSLTPSQRNRLRRLVFAELETVEVLRRTTERSAVGFHATLRDWETDLSAIYEHLITGEDVSC